MTAITPSPPRPLSRYPAHHPPSMSTSVPVIKPASGEQRYTANWPTSSTRPQRPSGILATNWALSSGFSISGVFISVAKGPGLMAFRSVHGQLAHFLHAAPAAQRDFGDELGIKLRILDQRGIHLRGEGTGADGVHRDSFRRKFQRQGAREAQNGALAGRIGGAARYGHVRHGGGQVDHAPVAAPFHVRHECAAHQEGAGQARVDYAPPLVQRKFGELLANVDAGVVDEDLDAPECLGDLPLKAQHLLLAGHIGLKNFRAAAGAPPLFGGLLQGLAIARHQGDGGAFTGQRQRHGFAQTAAGAGNQRHLAGQFAAHGIWPGPAALCDAAKISSATCCGRSTLRIVRRLASPAVSIERSPMPNIRWATDWSTRASCTFGNEMFRVDLASAPTSYRSLSPAMVALVNCRAMCRRIGQINNSAGSATTQGLFLHSLSGGIMVKKRIAAATISSKTTAYPSLMNFMVGRITVSSIALPP